MSIADDVLNVYFEDYKNGFDLANSICVEQESDVDKDSTTYKFKDGSTLELDNFLHLNSERL